MNEKKICLNPPNAIGFVNEVEKALAEDKRKNAVMLFVSLDFNDLQAWFAINEWGLTKRHLLEGYYDSHLRKGGW